MSRFTLHFVPNTALVSITSDGGTVTGQPAQQGPETVTITADKTSGFAPMAVWFEAVATGFGVDDPAKDLLYTWEFDDDGAEFADMSGRLGAIPVFKDANRAYGPWVAKVLTEPRSYSIRCAVRRNADDPPVYSNIIDRTPDNPDTVFGDARTVYVSTGTDFTGVPAGATKLTTNDASAAYASMGSPRRIKFKRGDTFTAPGTKGNWGKSLIEDWGNPASARPIFTTTTTGFTIRDSFTQAAIRNIVFKGTVSNLTATGTGQGVSVWESARGAIVFDNCASIGNDTGFSLNVSLADRPESSIAFLNCEVTDWINYGIYGGFHRGALHGCWVHQNAQGLKVDMRSGGGSAMRIEQTGQVGGAGFTHFAGGDVFCPYSGKFLGDQPPLKVQGNSAKDSRFNIDRYITEGSTNTSHGVGSTVAQRQNAIIDKLVHINTANCGVPLSIQQSGTTTRNFYHVAPFVEFEKLVTNKPSINNWTVNLNSDGSPADNKAARMEVYGCTSVIWQRWVEQAGLTSNETFYTAEPNSGFNNTVFSNNIVYAPHATTPQTSGTSVGPDIPGLFAYYEGRRHPDENGAAMQTQYATPEQFTFGAFTNQSTFTQILASGANLTIQAGPNDKLPIDYIDGTLRTTKVRGAFPPGGL